MGKVKDREFWQSSRRNNYTFMQYYNRLTELAISMFEWKGLPEDIDPRFLELCLFGDGMCIFFKDEHLTSNDSDLSKQVGANLHTGYLATRCVLTGKYDIYNIPTSRRAFASNGYNNSELNETNSVIIFNNLIHTNSVLEVENYSQRLWDLDRTIDINAKAQKTPVLIRCAESQRQTMINVYKKYDGNEPVIFGDNGLAEKPIDVLTTDAPYVADKLYQLKTEIWNEALTYLGISNINITKKERMITDEVVRNQGGTIASRYSRLEARRQAAEQINKMFGLKIEVNFREDYREANDDYMRSGDTGDGEVDPISEVE